MTGPVGDNRRFLGAVGRIFGLDLAHARDGGVIDPRMLVEIWLTNRQFSCRWSLPFIIKKLREDTNSGRKR